MKRQKNGSGGPKTDEQGSPGLQKVQNMNLGARERLGPVRMICLAITTSFKLHVVKGSFDTKISGREDPPQATP